MIIVSACLIGVQCKYNGDHNLSTKVLRYLEDKEYVPVCPEQLGGLATPREPAEILGKRVITISGTDVTEAFEKGARETLYIAKMTGCSMAILKDGSPSCGTYEVYDGHHTGKKRPGEGFCAKLLRREGLELFNEDNIDD